jgi:hypothetical protein
MSNRYDVGDTVRTTLGHKVTIAEVFRDGYMYRDGGCNLYVPDEGFMTEEEYAAKVARQQRAQAAHARLRQCVQRCETHEQKMDALKVAGQHEAADDSRDALRSALWDYWQALKALETIDPTLWHLLRGEG